MPCQTTKIVCLLFMLFLNWYVIFIYIFFEDSFFSVGFRFFCFFFPLSFCNFLMEYCQNVQYIKGSRRVWLCKGSVHTSVMASVIIRAMVAMTHGGFTSC